VVGTPDALQATHDGQQKPSRMRQCVGCLKSFLAFLFSTIGLTILLVGYTIFGGFIFRIIEAPNEVTPNFAVLRHSQLLF